MMPDLSPPFPLPGRGDRVLVVVSAGSRPGLVPAEHWCRVIGVDTGPEALFPVAVRLPNGRAGAYQQHEIRGWRPSVLRLIRSRLRA